MPTVNNHNHASGTFNNISGDQQNYRYDLQGAFVLFASPAATTQTISAFIERSNVPLKYHDVLLNIYAMCELLGDFRGQPFSPGYLLLPVERELTQFAAIVMYTTKALDVIDKIPGRLNDLEPFKNIAASIRDYGAQLRSLHSAMQSYKAEIDTEPGKPPGFWRGLRLYIYSYFRWQQLASQVDGLSLQTQRQQFGHFLLLLSSRDWRAIVSSPYGQQLQHLVQQAGLTARADLYHIQMQKILVRDHLGRAIPIPLEFCASWIDISTVLKHFCQNVEGNEFILRNDWELVSVSNGAIVDPSQFQLIVKPELELDVSVILQVVVSTFSTCPRCHYDNPRRKTGDGWINCYQCNTNFQTYLAFPFRNVSTPRDRPAKGQWKTPDQSSQRQPVKPPSKPRRLAQAVSESDPSVPVVPSPSQKTDYNTLNFHRISVRAINTPLHSSNTRPYGTRPDTNMTPERKGAFTSTLSMSSHKAKALLIGIDLSSPSQSLRDPFNDVTQMKNLLISRYHYKETDIVVMHENAENSSLLPTSKNILREIDNLVKGNSRGDRFVFHYSGHGSQWKKLDHSKEHELDEVLRISEEDWIVNDELRRRLVDPLCPGSQLVAIMDACHSGTLLDLPHIGCHFSSSTPDGLPGGNDSNPQPRHPFANHNPVRKDKEVGFYDEARRGCHCFLAPKDRTAQEDISNLALVLSIPACKDSQFSYENNRGEAMTSILLKQLQEDTNPTLGSLYTKIDAEFAAAAEARQRSLQWKRLVKKHKKEKIPLPNIYQHAAFSSLRRLNPKWRLAL